MGRLRAAALLLAVLAAGLLLAACGSSGKGELLPGTTADQITSNLDLVRESNAAGNCEEAEVAVAQVSEEIDALRGVDKQLKAALEEGAAKLSKVLSSCGAGVEAEEQKQAEEAQAEEEEQQQVEEEEESLQEEEAEEKAFEKEQKAEEREQEKAEKEAEQPGPTEEGEESGPKGKAKGHEKQEEIETPTEEEVIPSTEGEGAAGGIGPGAEAGGP